MKNRFGFVVLMALMAVGGAVLVWDRAETQAPRDELPLVASGVIQARKVSVASEFGGVVSEILVSDGESVDAGARVVQLDTSLLDVQISVAEATVDVAEAGLAQAQAGARAGQIAVGRAELMQARAAAVAVQQAVSDTAAILASPQDLDLQIAVLRAQIESARAQEAQAIALKDAAEVAKNAYEDARESLGGSGRHEFAVAEGDVSDLVEDALPDELSDRLPEGWQEDLPSLGERTISHGDYKLELDDGSYKLSVFKNIVFPLDANLLPNQWWQAWVGINAASAQLEGLETKLAQLYAQRAEPQVLTSQHSEAQALAAQLSAQVMMAEVQVRALEAGPSAEDLAVIAAQVDHALAGLQALEVQRDLLALTAPISGTVIDVLVREGEVAAQGAAVVSIADLRDLTLTVYIPETALGQVRLDQEVEVQVDSFPQRVFAGRVSYISDEAEFTPRNVATVEERQNLVFAVDVQLENADGALKPGMPADVRFVSAVGGQ